MNARVYLWVDLDDRWRANVTLITYEGRCIEFDLPEAEGGHAWQYAHGPVPVCLAIAEGLMRACRGMGRFERGAK